MQNVLEDKEEIIILAQYIQESSKRTEANTEKYQEVFAYKKVANWVKPVAKTLPEEFRIVKKIPSNPPAELPKLPTAPPDFTPEEQYTEERKNLMPINPDGFLWPEEEKLVLDIMRVHEDAFVWTEEEKGKFSENYFEPVVIPMVMDAQKHSYSSGNL